jgi:hypothetical protein
VTDLQARLVDGYEPDFDIDYEVGHQGELLVLDLISALREGRVEVKADEMAGETQRIYVEHECYRGGQWQPSGIAVTKADVWATVVSRGFVVAVPTDIMRRVHARAIADGRRGDCRRGSHPTRGALIPFTEFLFRILRETSVAA